ncbi:hypothetical protein [Sphingobium sp. UBA5915]|uniref:AbiU2 domain-containing protein n=1 Tax=Sphingobium sp. UBA5915 TaxID=1947530 RepID=UPI000C949F0B|nr:hypothetical protein [Sphingobium sp. UBA5915]MAM39557.1 hypothetical protein [Erythrobacter sp.]|tara:strand:- start:1234 stop:1923 length:690 start_codon:yes stop_codon:yes gene_type:complete
MTPAEIVDRMANLSRTLYSRCVVNSRPLWIIWQSYNDQNNPLRDQALIGNEGASAINRLANSALYETIMIVTRAFDASGRGGALRSDRASFKVLAELAQLHGVRDEVARRASAWFEDGWNADENARAALGALDQIDAALLRLDAEEPNRIRLMRNFRDQYLAHNLVFDIERERPIFGHITSMLEEMTLLVEASELALSGASIFWDMLDENARLSAEELWRTIRRGAATA